MRQTDPMRVQPTRRDVSFQNRLSKGWTALPFVSVVLREEFGLVRFVTIGEAALRFGL